MEIYKAFNPWVTCFRNVLFFANALFMIIGVFLIAVGAKITDLYNYFYYFLDTFYKFPVDIILAIGIILICVGCFGLFGAIKLHLLSLKLYLALLLALTVLNLSASAVSFVVLDGVEDHIGKKMFETSRKFETNEDVRYYWDYMQRTYYCCGVYFPENWYILKEAGNDSGVLLDYRGFTRRFPYSCCSSNNCSDGLIYDEGCANHVIDYVFKSTLFSAYLLLGMAAFQAITAIIAYTFCFHIQQCQDSHKIHKQLRGRSIILLSPDSITNKADFV